MGVIKYKVKDIAIYGAGGFGKEVACLINKITQRDHTWNMIGFFDDGVDKNVQISHHGIVLGDINDLNNWTNPLSIVFAIGVPRTIWKLVDGIHNKNIDFPNIIDPDSFYADPPTFKIGKGNLITRGCTFSCDVSIGDFNQFNSISALAHDVIVGSYNVFMPLVRVSGEVKIGNNNFFGIGSIILQQVKIGSNTRIGSGSVVISRTKDGFLYLGNPAKRTTL
jgi:sugar O-acyltransferase (sialic acid O-acetyltransferase NeuD family)